ncbi:queuosine precursor transporter [Spartinivicinus poritis]|uniref:Queuosine precursor transporter n=1 Tax=Spartinivicinus poritis TaxID=2994640 RepID=A0ABT5UFK8_9GAMM|nr:queuosine precursor transporter [Spartinivicinus sp. A2-2]MDE1465168.1 queuosine precursor transporter [Spartinivicinus sp. A2-2]
MQLQGCFFTLREINDQGLVVFQSKSGACYTEPAINLVEKNIIEHFSDTDAKYIAQVAKRDDDRIFINDTNNQVVVTLYSYWNWLPLLVALFIGFLLIAIPISPKRIEIIGFTQPGGILIFPLTFMVIDLISELFGYRTVRKVIWSAATTLLIAALGLYISLQLSNLVSQDVVAHYSAVFNKLPYLFLINAICLVAADFTNAVCFSRLKGLMRGKQLWFRSIVSTGLGQIVYTIVWISLFYIEKLASIETWAYMAENFTFKLGYAVMMIPFTYLLLWVIRRQSRKAQALRVV